MSFFFRLESPAGSLPTVERGSFVVSGECSDFESGVRSLTITAQIGSSTFSGSADLGSGLWQVTVQTPAGVRGGDTFDVSVTGFATLAKQPGSIGPSPTETGFDSVTCRLADHNPPQLFLNTNPALAGNATTAVDWTPGALPADFRVAGSVVEGDGRVVSVQCSIDNGPFLTVTSLSGAWATWEQHLSLGAGYHRIQVVATDGGGLTASVDRWINVHPTPDFLDGHTASITSWTRLEPSTRSADMGRTVSARLFDPLWMLTRQWQVGEFQGEDAGSPILARVRATSAPVTRYALGQLPSVPPVGKPYDALRTPLETVVERRQMRPADLNDSRALPLVVDAGLHLLHMLEQASLSKSYRAAIIARFPLPALQSPAPFNADDATQRFVQSMSGRAPDARQLATALRGGASATFVLDPSLSFASADQPRVKNAADAWVAWYDALVSEPQTPADDAWDPSRLEYSVSIAAALSPQASDELTLSAAEIDDGRLDWSNFDITAAIKLGAAGDKPAQSLVETTIPAPVTFRGMPAVRFWELEDSKISYGLMSVGPTDLAHLMMIEYAGSYGNDWFVVPLTVPVGSLTRVDSLVVTDTFGVQRLLRPIGAPGLASPFFSMWQHSFIRRVGDPSGSPMTNLFFLPPSLGRTEDGAAVEDVVFMRDEMANMAWAIERSVESGIEQPATRGDDTTAITPPTASSPDVPRYLLASTVPENWIPLVPVEVQSADGPTTLRLQRAALLQPDAGANKLNQAHTETLKALSPLRIFDEEVPREGARVTRLRRLSRWTDGSFWVWTAFRREVGRGEGSSALRYDQLISETTDVP